ncbi:response regulator transcription factor [Gluconobacter cerinus]|uniref:Regulatory protein VirG n=1 Tax=Gluconobacter cerinus TaxID=38307 RepID=A0A1B6VJ75_9PROT|nr:MULTISPECIES: response regulator transcription factor [Gluconobacter]MBM3097283.1 response regulator transcription factor [Gluconobacter cerinus]MBS0982485.1 response regulator transcription factor [Gluconobacter cerinus]MBS0993304.1 response regulator transcription factor [Gluconobacter cerinus]MBS1018492.1 response regulator transcription factor [Gluconobacter cerinus]MBS1021411.1 response regulator transcription factor [Gluconobacter cerinus]
MVPNLSDPDLPARILVVEDDAGMRTLILRALQGGGFRARGVASGDEMWAALEVAPVDLIILDIMLPGTNGIELCRALRNGQGASHVDETPPSQVPIIMVSARGEERDRVTGLESGADDYVPKPFGQRELLARVRAVLRRGSPSAAPEKVRRERLQFAGWMLDLRRRELTDPSGATVDISGAEHDLLTSFLDNPQRVIARDRLLELSRTRLGDVSDRSIDVLVSRLRRKLGSDADQLIRTVRGLGYIFVAEVERV